MIVDSIKPKNDHIEERRIIRMNHYCFDVGNINEVCKPRIHIPIANECILGCIYCDYYIHKNQGNNLYKPGTCNKLFNNKIEIVEYLAKNIVENCIIGVSGPGDPFQSLENLSFLIDTALPKFNHNYELCICTSAYNFSQANQRIDLKSIHYVTITINSLKRETIQKIYRGIKESIVNVDEFMNDQCSAIKFFIKNNVKIKVNCVYLPNINEDEIINMFTKLHEIGVYCFNLLPYSTENKYLMQFQNKLSELRKTKIPLLSKCKLCKSDSCFASNGMEVVV